MFGGYYLDMQGVACRHRLILLLFIFVGLHNLLDVTLHVEVILWDDIVLTFQNLLETRTVSVTGTYLPSRPVNTVATVKGCEKKRCNLRARATVSLSSSDSSSIPRMAMMSCRSL